MTLPCRRRLTRARASRCALPAGERGALALEFAIVFPLVLALTFGGVQVAFWYQARAMCQAAAQAGVRAGRVLDAPAGAGRNAAGAYPPRRGHRRNAHAQRVPHGYRGHRGVHRDSPAGDAPAGSAAGRGPVGRRASRTVHHPMTRRLSHGRVRPAGECGSASLELAIIAPALLVLLALVVMGGRFAIASTAITGVAGSVQESKGPIPAPKLRPAPGRDSTVYDVEAEGGLRPSARDHNQDDPVDLMTAMRRRSMARSRRKPGRRNAASGSPQADATTADADQHAAPEQAVTQQVAEHDRETIPLAADAQACPDPSLIDSQPEPATGLVELAPDGRAVEDRSPSESSSRPGDQTPQSLEESARQVQSKEQPKRPVRETMRKPGRPSVPAWDEIMFGSKPGADRSSS